MRPDFLLVAPTIGTKGLIYRMLNSVQTRRTWQVLINDSYDVSVAGKWNEGIRRGIMDLDVPLVIANDDIVFWPGAIDALLDGPEDCFLTGPQSDKLPAPGAIPTPFIRPAGRVVGGFSLFCLKPKVWENLRKYEMSDPARSLGHSPGMFDEEFFPAYYEDGDYYRRMVHCAGIKEHYCEDAWFYHEEHDLGNRSMRGSTSVLFDAERKSKSMVHMDKNKRRYQEKWGGKPHEEKFNYPFQDKSPAAQAKVHAVKT